MSRPVSRLTALASVVVLTVAVLAPAAAGHAADSSGDDTPPPTEVLIKPADSGDLLSVGGLDVASLPGVGDLTGVIDGIGVHVASVAPGTAERVAATLQALPGVDYAEPNRTFRVTQAGGAPDDPAFDQQYALQRINAAEGWARYREAKGYGGAFPATGGATIAVMDSGIASSHPELAGKVVACRTWLPTGLLGLGLDLGLGLGPSGCRDRNGHGTHNAGIAAAAADNGVGIAGVAFDARIQALQTCTVYCDFADVAAATVWAAEHGADVANFSFGSPHPSQAVADAVAHADRAGVLMVAASGNAGAGNGVSYPAAYDEVLTVTATDAGGALAPFSSTGPEVDVAAPGADILSLWPAGPGLRELSGTSQAAPHVAGLGALLMSLGANADQARRAILAGADDLGLPATQQGAGLIDVADSVRLITGG